MFLQIIYLLHLRVEKRNNLQNYLTFYAPIHEMVKHTQTIRRQIADELFECV